MCLGYVQRSPKGAFGGSTKPGQGAKEGWIGDRSNSIMVKKFEEGSEYLFFQNPTPITGVQPDLPSFLSPDNFADLQIKPMQIVVTISGFGSAAALVALLSGAKLPF